MRWPRRQVSSQSSGSGSSAISASLEPQHRAQHPDHDQQITQQRQQRRDHNLLQQADVADGAHHQIATARTLVEAQ